MRVGARNRIHIGDNDEESVDRHAMTKETGDAEPGEKRLEETQWRSCGFYRLSVQLITSSS